MKIKPRIIGNLVEVRSTEQLIVLIYEYIKLLGECTPQELLKCVYPNNYKYKAFRDIKRKLICLENLDLISIEKITKVSKKTKNNSSLKYFEYRIRDNAFES